MPEIILPKLKVRGEKKERKEKKRKEKKIRTVLKNSFLCFSLFGEIKEKGKREKMISLCVTVPLELISFQGQYG